MDDGGVDDPYIEFSVDEDFVIGIVPLDSFEFLVPLGGDLSALEPVFRRRSSLKKGIVEGYCRMVYH